jgi:Cys-tRNA(Pro)/Cys-tRNA(Cys) deacylase
MLCAGGVAGPPHYRRAMARAKTSGGTPATVALGRAGVPFTLHSYEHQSETTAYGEEAAAAVGVDPHRIFKTLIAELTLGHGGHELVVAVVPVSGSLDLKSLAAALGAKKAALADSAAASRSSGYVLGGISPFGQRTRLRTALDASASSFETVLVSAGKRGLQVELAPEDLVAVTGAVLAPIGT